MEGWTLPLENLGPFLGRTISKSCRMEWIGGVVERWTLGSTGFEFSIHNQPWASCLPQMYTILTQEMNGLA